MADLPVGFLAFDGAVKDGLAAGAAGEGDSVGGLLFADRAEIGGRRHLDGFGVDDCTRWYASEVERAEREKKV